MGAQQWEIERKYDIERDQAAGIKLHEVVGFTVQEPTIHDMSAAYYDTDDLALSRAKVAVRRRSGGDDDGWHVKYQAGKVRGEVFYDALKTSDRMPAALRKTLAGITLDQPLRPLATIDTKRAEYPVLTSEGQQHAVLCVDFVSARDERSGVTREWSECEVELSSHELGKKQTKAVFKALEAVLFDAGAVHSSSPAKIARALGQDGDATVTDRTEPDEQGSDAATEPSRDLAEDEKKTPSNGQEVLQAMCAHLTGQLQRWDLAARIGAEDSVHQLRTRSRALRSVLRAARDFIPEDTAADLQARLKSLARALSDARDQEVVAEQISLRLDHELPALVSASAREDVESALQSSADQADRAVRRALSAPEHVQLLTDLRALSRDQSFGEQAAQLSPKKFAKAIMSVALQDVVRKATHAEDGSPKVSELASDLGERMAAAGADPHDRAVCFDRVHDARKAIKSVRYLSDALGHVGASPGKKRTKAAARAKKYQDRLGRLTDSAVRERWLATAARSFQGSGTDRYVLGLLHGIELAELRAALDSAPKLVDGLVEDIQRYLPGD